MAESDDKKKRLEEISNMIGEAIIMAIKGPDSGQNELTNEDRENIKTRVANAFTQFLHHREWKEKTDPVIDAWRKAMLPKLIHRKLANQDSCAVDDAIKESFPSLDAEFEGHAILNLIAHMATVGPFRKLKDDTVAKIVEDEYMMIGLAISYLQWRVQTTTPPKGEQH